MPSHEFFYVLLNLIQWYSDSRTQHVNKVFRLCDFFYAISNDISCCTACHNLHIQISFL